MLSHTNECTDFYDVFESAWGLEFDKETQAYAITVYKHTLMETVFP